MNITTLKPGCILIEPFSSPLALDIHEVECTENRVALSIKTLERFQERRDREQRKQKPLLWHRSNLTLFDLWRFQSDQQRCDLSFWLSHFAFNVTGPFMVAHHYSVSPLIEGFLQCKRWIRKGSNPPFESLYEEAADVIESILLFMAEERERVCGSREANYSCESFLKDWYSNLDDEVTADPIFQYVDFPHFDMGIMQLTFVGTVWSADEIRVWSRPTYYHK